MRYWLAFALVVPVLLWTAYWGTTGFAVKHGAERFLQDERYGDLSSRFAEARLSGFPTEFQLNLSEVQFQRSDMFAWSVPEIRLSAPGHRPQEVSFDISGPQTVESHIGGLDIMAETFNIELFFRLAATAPLAHAQLLLEAGRLEHAAAGWQLGAERLLVAIQEDTGTTASADATMGLYQLELEASLLDISEILTDLAPAYQQIDAMTADMGLIFSRAWDRSLLDSGPPALRGVVIRNGEILFENTSIVFSGQLDVSDRGLLSGEIIIDVQGWRGFLNAFHQAGYLDEDIAELILYFLGRDGDADEVATLPLTFQDGAISFGVFTLGFLPPMP